MFVSVTKKKQRNMSNHNVKLKFSKWVILILYYVYYKNIFDQNNLLLFHDEFWQLVTDKTCCFTKLHTCLKSHFKAKNRYMSQSKNHTRTRICRVCNTIPLVHNTYQQRIVITMTLCVCFVYILSRGTPTVCLIWFYHRITSFIRPKKYFRSGNCPLSRLRICNC